MRAKLRHIRAKRPCLKKDKVPAGASTATAARAMVSDMKRSTMLATTFGVLAAVGGGGFAAFHYLRGPSGTSELYGGSIAAVAVPDFPSQDASDWANGGPASLASLRGAPVLLEFWSPS